MYHRFTMPRDEWDETNPNKWAILQLINKHIGHVPELIKLKEYYEGRHEILAEKDTPNKLVCNHAKDISDTASAYFLGNPVTYDSDQDLTPLLDLLNVADADEVDGDNALDLSIYGRAYDYIYTKLDSTELAIKNLAPENTFVVYDDTIEQRPMFAVYYYAQRDDSDLRVTRYIATVLTNNYKWVLNIQNMPGEQSLVEDPEQHYLGEIPITEWQNNKLCIGDFALQIPLIDAYNTLMSERMTDKEQFIDALLVIYGSLLSDEEGDEDETSAKMQKRLKTRKLLEMPDGSKAEYLTRTFDESGVEILKKALEQDIHKFSHIPCMTDESFGGNVSGVAMEYKLLGMENITKIKTRYYRIGLKKRLRIFCNWLRMMGRANIDHNAITATFSRALPKNLLEISQYVANLQGVVSRKTLLAQIPFVTDPDSEIAEVEAENDEAARRQQEIFRGEDNTPPDFEDEEDEDRPERG